LGKGKNGDHGSQSFRRATPAHAERRIKARLSRGDDQVAPFAGLGWTSIRAQKKKKKKMRV